MIHNPTSRPHPPHVLNLIGYWASPWYGPDAGPGWPDPRDVIGPWDAADRQAIIHYLQGGIVFEAYKGFSLCRICQVMLGSCELTDGRWAWPEKLEHYVEAHDVQLPPEFVAFARASAWSIPTAVKRVFALPRRPPVILRPDAWLDWAATAAPARPAADATPIEEAQALCARLSHRTWHARLEERGGRWRIICGSGADDGLLYVERGSAEQLQRRLLAWRAPDPDALLDSGQANAIACEFDGPWGSLRVRAATTDWWLVWAVPAGSPEPTEREVRGETKHVRVGWLAFRQEVQAQRERIGLREETEGVPTGFTTIRWDGSQSFLCPRLDELQWRLLADRTRARTRPRPAAPPPQPVPLARPLFVAIAEPGPDLRTRLRDLWRHVRAFVRR
jgi:hypothetical protein